MLPMAAGMGMSALSGMMNKGGVSNPQQMPGDSLSGQMGSGIATSIAGRAGGAIGDQLFGDVGDKSKEAMDKMYPGTTPWERLGAGGGGAPSSVSGDIASKRLAGSQNKQTNQQTALIKAQTKDAENRAGISQSQSVVEKARADRAADIADREATKTTNQLPAKGVDEVNKAGDQIKANVKGLRTRGNTVKALDEIGYYVDRSGQVHKKVDLKKPTSVSGRVDKFNQTLKEWGVKKW